MNLRNRVVVFFYYGRILTKNDFVGSAIKSHKQQQYKIKHIGYRNKKFECIRQLVLMGSYLKKLCDYGQIFQRFREYI